MKLFPSEAFGLTFLCLFLCKVREIRWEFMDSLEAVLFVKLLDLIIGFADEMKTASRVGAFKQSLLGEAVKSLLLMHLRSRKQ
jgi:hypothetical protein